MSIGEIKGYCILKSKDDNFISSHPNSFKLGHPYRIMDIAVDNSGFLILNSEGTAIAQVNLTDVSNWFRCDTIADVICKPGLSMLDKISYQVKVYGRKGGYNRLLRSLVITASLNKGEFCDSILWQKQ